MMTILDELLSRYPDLTGCRMDIDEAFRLMVRSYDRGGQLLLAGNGGSASDCEHIVGELMKSFVLPRPLQQDFAENLSGVHEEMGSELASVLQSGLPAISLTGFPALSSAFINDCHPLMDYAQIVNALGRPGDVFWGISTSGNSRNVCYAAVTAKARGLSVIAMTGSRESTLSRLADVCIRVPRTRTYQVQELHLPVYHALCMMLENHYYGKENSGH